jgi:hypothetical protein
VSGTHTCVCLSSIDISCSIPDCSTLPAVFLIAVHCTMVLSHVQFLSLLCLPDHSGPWTLHTDIYFIVLTVLYIIVSIRNSDSEFRKFHFLSNIPKVKKEMNKNCTFNGS